jgi:hypothetical protein
MSAEEKPGTTLAAEKCRKTGRKWELKIIAAGRL